MSNQWISRLRKRLDDNRRYRRAMAEVSTLTTRDLVDMRGSREEMQRYIYEEIYGGGTAEVLHFNFGEALRQFMASFGQRSTGSATLEFGSSPHGTAGSARDQDRTLALH